MSISAIVSLALLAQPFNLVVNGGFESWFSGWTGTYGLYGDSPNTVDGTWVGVLTDIGHSSVYQTLTQSVATTPGVAYQIAFALRLPDLFEIAPGVWVPVVGNSIGGATTISVRWDDRALIEIPVFNRDTWSFYTVRAVADGDAAELNFFNPSDAAWPFIDAVSVVAIPEPWPAALLPFGAALAWISRARRGAPAGGDWMRPAHPREAPPW